MTQYSSPRRRALIVEDEVLIAFDLEATMSALGFDVCDLAPSGERARSLAMSDQPDVVLRDVCLTPHYRTCGERAQRSPLGVPRTDLAHRGRRAAVRNLGRVLINRQPYADLDVPPNVRYWG
jgi:DNA-binding NarL/FixJ family response regulator